MVEKWMEQPVIMNSARPLPYMTTLWQFASALVNEIQKEPGLNNSDGFCKRIQLKFNHVVSNMSCVGDIVATLFQKEMITQREREDISNLASTPTRANEELLNVIMRKDNEVFESFLKVLLDTNQHHIHKLLIAEVEECSTLHSDVIRRNFKWLVEKLEPSNGLSHILYEKKVLSGRELESLDSENDTFKKNDKLLSLISRKCPEHYELFLLALKETKQIHVCTKLQLSTLPNSAPQPPPKAKRSVFASDRTVSPVPPPLIQPAGQNSTNQTRSVTKTIPNIREKRTSVLSLRKNLPQMSDQHQYEISFKVIAIRHRSRRATSNVFDTCLMNVLQGFGKLKEEAQKMNQEKSELRQCMADFVRMEQIQAADELRKLKLEVSYKNMEITGIKSKSEKELVPMKSELKTLREKLKTESTGTDKLKRDNKKLTKEKSELEDVVKRLKAEVAEQRAEIERLRRNGSPTIIGHAKESRANTRMKYKETPTLLMTIERDTNCERNGLSRLAILDNELYIISQEGCELEVYDLFKFNVRNRWSLEDVENVEDIGACDQHKCLYIIHWDSKRTLEEVLRVNRNGVVVRKWLTSECQGRLSVAHDTNIILTVYTKNKLKEYSSDGQLKREINLPSSIKQPQHARKLTNGQYVVSHGSGFQSDTIHGVGIVDVMGNVLKSFGAEFGSGVGALNHPVYLTIDRGGNILVADLNNSRVVLLSSTLEFIREIVSEKDGLQHPRRICLDESNGRLVAACGICNQSKSNAGQVLVFGVEER